jgi:aspartate 1-decarboxylase
LKRLSLLSAFIALIFVACGFGAKEANISCPQNIFLEPGGFYIKPADSRPKVYNVYAADGEYKDSFSSLYQGIDYVKNLEDGGYIENARYPDKKVFFLTRSPQCFIYKNGTTLEDIIDWESADIGAYQDCISIINPPARPFFHSFQSNTEIPVTPSPDAYYMRASENSIRISLSKSKIYPSKSQTVFAKIGFVIYIDRFSYFAGLVCDTNCGDWYYCFDNIDNAASEECVLLSDYKNGYFVPQDDVEISINNIPFSDAGENYLKNNITLDFSQGRTYAFENILTGRNYKTYFIAALDIQASGVPDYMNGAKWENIIIQSEEDKTDLIYNTAAVKITQNRDNNILNFTYDFDAAAPVYSPKIARIQENIDRLPRNVTRADRKKIQDAIKAFNNLSPGLRSLIDTQNLTQAKDQLYNLWEGLEKAKLIAQDLKPALEADNEYIIDNYGYIFEAYDLLYNQTPEEERENFSQYYKTKISAYYNRAVSLYTQVTEAKMAIEAAKNKTQILEAYQKYIILDEAQKKILGKDYCSYYEKALKNIDQKVLNAVSRIIDLGKCAPADYPLVYGVQNCQKMRDLIDSYESMSKPQKNLIPSRYQKIYNTASKYFNNQIDSLKKLKKLIERTPNPAVEDANKWLDIYNQLDIASKWSFKNDSKYGGEEYYKKLETTAASFGYIIE